MSSDPLLAALTEAGGQLTPDGVIAPTPRFTLRCAECDELLGEVFATRHGALYRWKQPRVRFRVTDPDGRRPERMVREPQLHAFLLAEMADDIEVRCRRHGWCPVGPAVRLRSLVDRPPAGGVLPLIPS